MRTVVDGHGAPRRRHRLAQEGRISWPSLSTRCTSRPAAASRIASTRPGKPAPAAEVDPERASGGKRQRAARCRRWRARTRPGCGADQVHARPASRPAARVAARAGPMFHVKHRKARRASGPASRVGGIMAGQAVAAPARLTWARAGVSAAGVTPSMRAAWPSVAGRTRGELLAHLGREAREPADSRGRPGGRAPRLAGRRRRPASWRPR